MPSDGLCSLSETSASGTGGGATSGRGRRGWRYAESVGVGGRRLASDCSFGARASGEREPHRHCQRYERRRPARRLEWGPADFDVRHRVVANWLWEMPFLRDAGGLKASLLGGWQVNGVIQWQTGYPFSVTTSSPYPTGDYNGDGVNNDRPNTPT